MDYANGEVRLPLAAYDLLKREEAEWQRANAELYEIRMALGCKPGEMAGRIKELLENQKTIDDDDDATTGRLVRGMLDGARLHKDEKGWNAFGGNTHPEWYRGPHPMNALSGAGIEEAE